MFPSDGGKNLPSILTFRGISQSNVELQEKYPYRDIRPKIVVTVLKRGEMEVLQKNSKKN